MRDAFLVIFAFLYFTIQNRNQIVNEDVFYRFQSFAIFRTNPFVVMSWGINPATITIVEVGVKFHVQGFIHTGYVQVVLNEGEDLFEVTLISEEGETLNKIEHIFVDNLICVIDEAVEKCENYQERISQEYSITTESEK